MGYFWKYKTAYILFYTKNHGDEANTISDYSNDSVSDDESSSDDNWTLFIKLPNEWLGVIPTNLDLLLLMTIDDASFLILFFILFRYVFAIVFPISCLP